MAGWELSSRRADTLALSVALCAVPISIAIAESLLAVALVVRLAILVRSKEPIRTPRVFWFWLVWAGLEVAVWIRSPEPAAGFGEFRHLLLIGALFLILPALRTPLDAVTIWRGIFLSATASSAVLIVKFAARAIQYRQQIATADDPGFFVRNGGLLNHWMVYSTVEIFVFAALLEFWRSYPEKRRWMAPMLAVNLLGIVLSLTRMLWIACFVMLALHLLWRHSRWIWSVPVLPALIWVIPSSIVHSRVSQSLQPDFFSNAERVQMLRVGWKMIRSAPFTGVGPGRAGSLYTGYLAGNDPVPAYHGHLHNNAVQLAAEFGLPVVAAVAVFLCVLFIDLRTAFRAARDEGALFLCRTSLIGLAGFLVGGLFDYTYGHSLGLIMASFVLFTPLVGRPTQAV